MTQIRQRQILSAVKRVCKVQAGFKHIEKEATRLSTNLSRKEAVSVAEHLLTFEHYQARMLATELLRLSASTSRTALRLLRNKVSTDENWRVQEMLARAVNDYCAQVGYGKALRMIRSWIADKRPNVRRAISEGLRVWTKRDYFREHPEVAVKILSTRLEDESPYVLRSVKNALRDISKQHPKLVKSAMEVRNARF